MMYSLTIWLYRYRKGVRSYQKKKWYKILQIYIGLTCFFKELDNQYNMCLYDCVMIFQLNVIVKLVYIVLFYFLKKLNNLYMGR